MSPEQKNQKFREILTLDRLDAEIVHVRSGNRIREEELRGRIAALPEFYTPQTLAREGVRRVTRSVSFYGILLNAVTFAKAFLRKKKK